jgi:hypothetical protein
MRMSLARRSSAAAVLALSFAGAAPLAAQGVGFTLRSASGDNVTSASGGSATRVRTRGAVMRFDAVADGKQSKDDFGEGAYTLIDAAGRRIQIVMPGQKQYMEIKFDDSTATAIRTVGTVSTAVTDLKVSGQSLGSGGVVNGMPTTKHRMTTDFTELTAGGERPRKLHIVEEYWVSDALRDVIDPLEQLGRALGGKASPVKSPYAALGGSSVNDLLSRRMAEQQKLFKGFPVKTVTTSEETQRDGSVQKTVTVTEVTDVQKGDFDVALFKVPEGYTAFDPKAMLGNMNAQFRDALRGAGRDKADAAKGQADTTSLKDAAKEGAKDAVKDAGKDAAVDAVKNKLGGFLKKKKP